MTAFAFSLDAKVPVFDSSPATATISPHDFRSLPPLSRLCQHGHA
jgi:hypothetical protein